MLSFAPAAPEEVGLCLFMVATWLFLALSESFSVFLPVSIFLFVFVSMAPSLPTECGLVTLAKIKGWGSTKRPVHPWALSNIKLNTSLCSIHCGISTCSYKWQSHRRQLPQRNHSGRFPEMQNDGFVQSWPFYDKYVRRQDRELFPIIFLICNFLFCVLLRDASLYEVITNFAVLF